MSKINDSDPPSNQSSAEWPNDAIIDLLVIVEKLGGLGELFGEDKHDENPHIGYQSLVCRFKELHEFKTFARDLDWRKVKTKFKKETQNVDMRKMAQDANRSKIVFSHDLYITRNEEMMRTRTEHWSDESLRRCDEEAQRRP